MNSKEVKSVPLELNRILGDRDVLFQPSWVRLLLRVWYRIRVLPCSGK